MFQKTKIQLAMMNTSILMIILVTLGTSLYFFTEHRILSQVDTKMLEDADPYIAGNNKRIIYIHQEKLYDDRSNMHKFIRTPTLFIMWNEDQQITNQYPLTVFEREDLKVLSSRLSSSEGQTVTLKDHSFRLINIVETFDNGQERKILQVVRNIDQEAGMLNDLKNVILMGIGIGGVFSIFAAFYLAQRSLKPIQASWEKQQQFVADASHELRTPLAAIQANTELLLHYPEKTIESESKTIANVLKETKRLNKLVSHLLTLARTDSNQIQLHKKEIDLHPLIQSVTEQFTILCEIKSVKLLTNIETTLFSSVDEEKVKQLLYIVLDNALKYTDEGGEIFVSAKSFGNKVEIKIKDNGKGIKKEDLPLIFNRFYRGDKARTSSGSGLGLSIAKWIVDAHEGKIKIESEVGQGTVVHISL
ncbi:HAMP domain-containing histidine kinase [Bacillus timonensis]|nr:HAMP domain-containing histidine kinase [Bacillus timonensis]